MSKLDVQQCQPLLDGLNMPLYLADTSGRIVVANQAFLSLFMVTSEELKDLDLVDMIVSPEHANINTIDKNLIENGGRYSFEGEVRIKGSTDAHPVLINKSPINCDSEGCLAVLTVLQMRGLYQEMRNALDATESQIKAILEGYPGVLALFNADHKLTWANKGMEHFAPGSIGKGYEDIFRSPEGFSPGVTVLENALKGQRDLDIQQVLSTDGEEELFFEFIGTPVKGSGKKISGAIIICRDVTEKFKLEKQLRHAQKMEAIGTLAGGIAHDFNNVLTPIMGYSEILRLKFREFTDSESEVEEYIGEILRAARRAKSLVEQILTFSRATEKKESLQYIHPIVKEVMKLMRVTLPSSIKITEKIDEDCGMVSVDPVQIHQVLINLCTNSSHALVGGKGKIVVTLSKSDLQKDNKKWIKLSVEDDGCGIESSMIDRIFEPYFTTKEKERGTGMGLAMVHGIIVQQGGFAEVNSKIGEGTVFNVFLPVAESGTTFENIISSEELVRGEGHILLVDDEEQVVQVNTELLKNLGYDVTGVTSSLKARDILLEEGEKFSLMITDLVMPDLTGLELAEQSKEIVADLPVILFTGYSDQFSKDDAKKMGIKAFCVKPISFGELAKIVNLVISEKDRDFL